MPHRIPPEQALERLLSGNQRYAADIPERPNQCSVRRAEVAGAQYPFAAVIGCSDSRVPVEVIFDVGVGDLFVIRTAGNLIEDVGIASVEFAVSALGVGLVMVMGHRRCGAVQAAVNAVTQPEPAEVVSAETGPRHHLPALVAKIQPAVDAVLNKPGDLLDNAIDANTLAMARRLVSRSTVISDAVRQGTLRIVSARYDLDTAKVELLGG